MFGRAPIRKARGGGYVIDLSDNERVLLKSLPAQLISLLGERPASSSAPFEIPDDLSGLSDTSPPSDPMDDLASLGSGSQPERDPLLGRLFPAAYNDPGDQSLDAEYQRYMGHELAKKHKESLQVLADTAGARNVSEDQLLAWMRALNSIRLVLGTRLGVTEEDQPGEDLDTDHVVYHYLGYVQECTIQALSEG